MSKGTDLLEWEHSHDNMGFYLRGGGGKYSGPDLIFWDALCTWFMLPAANDLFDTQKDAWLCGLLLEIKHTELLISYSYVILSLCKYTIMIDTL